MRRMLAALAAFLLFAVPGLSPALAEGFQGLSGELRIAGSEIGLPAFRQAAEKVMAENPGVKISFSLSGAGMGLTRLRMNQADICLYDRDPRPIGVSLEHIEFVEYGIDPVVVALNPANAVGSLSMDQAAGLFTGRIPAWNLIGGEAVRVIVVYVEASEEPGHPDTRSGTLSVSSQPAMRFSLVRNREAVGITSLRDVDGSLKPAVLDGVAPSIEAFKAGQYRVYRVMRAAISQTPSPLAKAFMDFMSGPQGQAILERSGYLPLSARPSFQSPLPVDFPDLLVKR